MIKHELWCEAPKVVSTRAAGSPEAVLAVLFPALSDRKFFGGTGPPQQPSSTAMIYNANSAHAERGVNRESRIKQTDLFKEMMNLLNKTNQNTWTIQGFLGPKRVTQPSEYQTKLNKDWNLSGDN